jgi:hypothetical protein
MTRPLIAPILALLVLSATGALAQSATLPLFDLLRLPEMLEVMREEGMAYGQSIDDEMLGGQGGADWQATLEVVYDVERMRASVEPAIDWQMTGIDPAPIHAFFSTSPGSDILALELSARWAMLDPEIEASATAAAAEAFAAKTPRMARITEFSARNDLIERNVMGAMNSNLAFYHGMMAAGALPPGLTEDQILADVWAQEPEIRVSTVEWLYSYLNLAYQPLSDEDLDAYIAFTTTPEGSALNAAVFAAFDALFEDISLMLGSAVSPHLSSQDL